MGEEGWIVWRLVVKWPGSEKFKADASYVSDRAFCLECKLRNRHESSGSCCKSFTDTDTWRVFLWAGSKGVINFPRIFFTQMWSLVPVGFKRSHRIHLGWWSTGSAKLQPFQLSQHSHVTNCRLISSSAYFPLNITLKYIMHLSESYILSRRHSVFRKKKYFWSGGLSLGAIHQSSESSFRDFFVKITKES